ncbi:MAG TPA: S8 family serine peptidase [Thermoanaerobaculia bacterium]|nr:S8 family serine peptidase [Thermoanaerobaculia bacterium]
MLLNGPREASRLRRGLFACLLCLFGLGFAGAAVGAEDSRYEIRLLTGTLTPPARVPSETMAGLTARAAVAAQQGQRTIHVLVQLHVPPTPEEARALSRDGLDLGPYATGNAWIAAVPVERLARIPRLSQVRWLAPWDASMKLHPRVRAGQFGEWTRDPAHPGWVMTFVQLHKDVPLERGSALAAAVGGVAMEPVKGLHGLTLWVPEKRAGELAAFEEVLWVEEGPMPLSPTNDGVRAQMKVNTVQAAPYGLNGANVRLFVFDGGAVEEDHSTFSGIFGSRAQVIDDSDVIDHATHVAGTAAGNGSGSDFWRARGVAPLAFVYSAGYEETGGTISFWDNAGDIESDYALAANSYNIDLATNSLGSNLAKYYGICGVEGDYGQAARLIDGIVRGDNPAVGRPMLVTWSASNERIYGCGGGYHTMAPPACAKNPIHVGAINSDGGSMTAFSSWGPCDDGRLKPVVVAPGCETGAVTGEMGIYSSVTGNDYSATLDGGPICGTSMATPAVAGTLALFLQDWRAQGHGGPTDRPLAALVKAMLIHTAKDLGTAGPDYMFGYGAVDAKALIDLLRADNGTLGDGSGRQWGRDTIAQGEVKTYSISVTSGTPELKATLAWDDPAAEALAANALINNLTLELAAPGGTIYKAWALSAGNPGMPAVKTGNSVDNQEQVVVSNPAAGTWLVRITGTAVPLGPQEYGLAYSTGGVAGNCTTRTWDFEAGTTPGLVVNGGEIVAAPAGGGVNGKALRLQRLDSVFADVTIPTGAVRAELDYSWLMQTDEEGNWDFLWVSIVDPRNWNTLAVVDLRSDGWPEQWMTEPSIDLTPWAGQTIRIFFEATEPEAFANPTDHFLDNLKVTTCLPLISFSPSLSFTSIAAQDGSVGESSQNSSVGGTVSNLAGGSIQVGDSWTNAQHKGFLSFDTSAIPAGATILRARLRLHRKANVSGINPFLTHGAILADVKSGGFGVSTDLVASDFQAAETVKMGAALTPALNDGDFSESYLSSDALAAINKSGTTQLRLYFHRPDDSDGLTDLIYYDSGDAATSSHRPTLIVTYAP